MSDVPVNIRLSALDNITRPLRVMRVGILQFGKTIDGVNLKMEAFAKRTGLTNLGKQFSNVGSKLSGIGSQIGSIASKVAIFGGLAGGFLVHMAKEAADSAEQLQNLSDRSGIGIERLQTLGIIAHEAGVSNEDFAKGIDVATIRIGELKRGVGPLATELKKISPSLAAQLKKTKNADEAFSLMNLAMNKTTDATLRLQLAQALFGKGGAKLMSVVGMTTEEFKAAQEEASKFVKTADEQKKFLQLDKAFDKLGSTLTMFGQKALGPILEPLIAIIDAFTKLLGDLIGPLQNQLKGLVSEFLAGRDAATAVKETFNSFMETISPLVNILKFLFDTFGAGRVIMVAVAAVIFGPLLASIVALIPALFSLGAAFLTLTWPAQLAIAAVVALIAIGALLIANWEKVKKFFVDMWESPIAQMALMMSPIGFLITAGKAVFAIWEKVSSLFSNMKLDTSEISRLEGEKKKAQDAAFAQGPLKPVGFSAIGPQTSTQNSSVFVDFANMPKGTKVRSESQGDLSLNLGFAGGLQ